MTFLRIAKVKKRIICTIIIILAYNRFIPLQLSVIIVNYNVKHFLEQCLFSVFKALKNIDSEVFVVDNNSVDGSVQMLKEKFPQVHLIANRENTGFAVANNQALKLTQGKFVLLLNPDTVVQEDTFQKCIDFMEARADCGGLGIKMLDGKGNFLPESKRGLPTPQVAFYKIFGLAKLFPHSKKFGQYHLTFLNKNQNHKVDVLSGAFMMMRKEVLDKIGYLDETFFMYGEDIDLSYRITKGGWNNYYFAESNIIHYKGESTKKSSVNYVIVFYKAMAIFAKKHFSQSHARSFSFLIYLAIYLRAGAAILTRVFKQLLIPSIDLTLIISGLFICKYFYETHFKLYPNFYSNEMVNLFFPVYTLIWMFFVYISGGYDNPLKLKKIVRGVFAGTALILIIYSLLPEYYRFSRALILIGSVSTLLIYLITRLIYHFTGIQKFKLGAYHKSNRIAIIGSEMEYERVKVILEQTKLKADFIGFVSSESNGVKKENYLGQFSQINEIIDVHNIQEIIFCARDISSKEIIDKMVTFVTKGVEFKIAPPESLSIIGSNSIDTAGDLYVIDFNNVGRPENKRKKRLLDISVSLFLLVFFWIWIWFQKNKFNFLINCFKVLLGINSWVGYGKALRKDLPSIRPSILIPYDPIEKTSPDQINRALLDYSKDYKIENDIFILYKNMQKLGN
ncbi:MAG: glycosyltransferase [Sphingobacteriaceae bacterium]|nr:glycosyltransferase [Sphingobacteriaceae bacterium]